MQYKVYFILEGKKLKMTVKANSQNAAKEVIKNKYAGKNIDFVTCMPIYNEDKTLKSLKNIFGI